MNLSKWSKQDWTALVIAICAQLSALAIVTMLIAGAVLAVKAALR